MKRLVESLGDEVARSALRSARQDGPSASSRERAALAVGLAAGSVVVASAGKAAAASVTKVAAATTGAAAASTSGVGVVAAVAPGAPLVIPGLGGGLLAGLGGAKLVAVVVTVGALAVGALSVPSSTPPASRAPVRTAPSLPPPPEPARQRAWPAPAVAAEEVSAPHAPSPPVPAAVATPTAPVPPAPPTTSSVAPAVPAAPEDLTQSMALLESARGALAAGEPARALPVLAGYERRFPNGALRQEAEVLTIDALAAARSDDAALAAAARFLSAAPDSPHAKHVRAVAGAIRAARTNP